jgi:hypothetical protein
MSFSALASQIRLMAPSDATACRLTGAAGAKVSVSVAHSIGDASL